MSELRQSPATKEWVIIATERAKRPDDFSKKTEEPVKKPAYDAKCPFCHGNENLCTPEVFAYREKGTAPNTKGWTLRVVPNKFAALYPGELIRSSNNFFKSMTGIGVHEVVVETPEHHLTMGTMSVEQIERVISAYNERYHAISEDKRMDLITIFRNNGKSAGTSLEHPHSQIIASPIVPVHIRYKIQEAVRYFDDTGRCVYCDAIKEELATKDKIVAETKEFVVIEPFASRTPFETWIVPKRHDASFKNINTTEKKDLAKVLRETLGKLYVGLNDPSYNLMIHSAPRQEDPADYYHWHIQIVPRITTPAGFELGSGIYINVVKPEDAAKFLREMRSS
jgi:UDPglucose--hexose-1-phosphate uridylyltransferase